MWTHRRRVDSKLCHVWTCSLQTWWPLDRRLKHTHTHTVKGSVSTVTWDYQQIRGHLTWIQCPDDVHHLSFDQSLDATWWKPNITEWGRSQRGDFKDALQTRKYFALWIDPGFIHVNPSIFESPKAGRHCWSIRRLACYVGTWVKNTYSKY